MDNKVELFYDEHAKEYQKYRTKHHPISLINELSLIKTINDENISLNNANIIDIGCGNGYYSRFLC